jgi:hypothetical protein
MAGGRRVIAVDVRDRIEREEVPNDEARFLASLDRPTIFRVRGRDGSRTRAVSAMLHGNEPSGFRAVHALLRADEPPAVDLVCFVGAVQAARAAPPFSHRMLPDRRDLNRCFRAPWDGVDGAVARDVLAVLREARPEALVDLHNNSGHNPPYAIATHVTPARLGLASLLVDRVIESELRLGSLMEAFGAVFPAITVECGRSGTRDADRVARDGLARYASVDRLPLADSSTRLRLYGDALRVTLRPGAVVEFASAPKGGADLTLDADVDRHNFTELAAGTRIGWVTCGAPWPLEARDAEGQLVSRVLFECKGGELVTAQPIIPVMMTTDPAAAACDCLFYIVREL